MKSFDAKKYTDLIILDFSKAFDTVPHKLNNYGIDGKINKWIENFLTQRQQRVIVEGVFIIMLSRIWSTPKNRPWTSSCITSMTFNYMCMCKIPGQTLFRRLLTI